jgi:hypothetical protein
MCTLQVGKEFREISMALSRDSYFGDFQNVPRFVFLCAHVSFMALLRRAKQIAMRQHTHYMPREDQLMQELN